MPEDNAFIKESEKRLKEARKKIFSEDSSNGVAITAGLFATSAVALSGGLLAGPIAVAAGAVASAAGAGTAGATAVAATSGAVAAFKAGHSIATAVEENDYEAAAAQTVIFGAGVRVGTGSD